MTVASAAAAAAAVLFLDGGVIITFVGFIISKVFGHGGKF